MSCSRWPDSQALIGVAALESRGGRSALAKHLRDCMVPHGTDRAHAIELAQQLKHVPLSSQALAGAVNALQSCAVAAIRLHFHEEAIALLDIAISFEEQNRDLRLMRSRIYLRRQEYEKSLIDLSAILLQDPFDLPVASLLSLLPDTTARIALAETLTELVLGRLKQDSSLGPSAVSIFIRLLAPEAARSLLQTQEPIENASDAWLVAAQEFAVATHDLAMMRRCLPVLRSRTEVENLISETLALNIALEAGEHAALTQAFNQLQDTGGLDRIDQTLRFVSTLALGKLDVAYRKLWNADRDRQLAQVFPNFHPTDRPLCELDGKSVLLIGYTELGDEIRLVDLVDRARQRFSRCTVVVDSRLAPLLARGRAGLDVVGVDKSSARSAETNVPPILWPHVDDETWARSGGFDAVLMFRQLESLMINGAADLPSVCYVLQADPVRRENFKAVLGNLGSGAKIGLFWRSSRTNYRRSNRVTRLEDWTPILRQPEAQFISLQFGNGFEDELDAARLATGVNLHVFADLDARNDLESLAALMSELDCIVAVPSTTQHLAGALGKMTLAVTHPSMRLSHARPDSRADMWAPAAEVISGPGELGYRGAIAATSVRLASWLEDRKSRS